MEGNHKGYCRTTFGLTGQREEHAPEEKGASLVEGPTWTRAVTQGQG